MSSLGPDGGWIASLDPSEEVKPQREMDTRQCANKDARPRIGWIGGPTSIREENE